MPNLHEKKGLGPYRADAALFNFGAAEIVVTNKMAPGQVSSSSRIDTPDLNHENVFADKQLEMEYQEAPAELAWSVLQTEISLSCPYQAIKHDL